MGCRSTVAMCSVMALAGCSAAMRTAPTETSIRGIDRARFAAMVARDMRALDTLLADDLTYSHTTGRVDTKASLLDDLRAGRVVYDSIVPTDTQVRLYSGVAVVTGTARMQVRAGPQLLRFSARFTEVYADKQGRWQLVSWQSTRLPDP